MGTEAAEINVIRIPNPAVISNRPESARSSQYPIDSFQKISPCSHSSFCSVVPFSGYSPAISLHSPGQKAPTIWGVARALAIVVSENKNINPMKIEVPLSHQGFGAKNCSDTVERLGYGLIV